MQVGGVIGAGAGGPAAGAIGGPAGSASLAAAGPSGTAGLNAMGPTAIQSLVQILANYSTAEILMALFLAAALGKRNDSEHSSDSLALLATLALAAQIQQSFGVSINFPGQSVGPDLTIPSGLGMTINIVA